MARIEWECPLTTLPTIAPIFTLNCGHSFSKALLDVNATMPTDQLVRCPHCRADTGLTSLDLSYPNRLTRNYALEAMTGGDDEIDTEKEELLLDSRRKHYALETTQIESSKWQTRYTVAMQDMSDCKIAMQEFKRKHEDLAYDVAFETDSLRDWRSERAKERMRERQRGQRQRGREARERRSTHVVGLQR